MSIEYNREIIKKNKWDASYAFSFYLGRDFVPKMNDVLDIIEFTCTRTGLDEYKRYYAGTLVCSALFKLKYRHVHVVFPFLPNGIITPKDGYTPYSRDLNVFPSKFDLVIASFSKSVIADVLKEVDVYFTVEKTNLENVYVMMKK